MKYEKILKREDKSTIKIEIDVLFPNYRDREVKYTATIFKRAAGKRKWHPLVNTSGWHKSIEDDEKKLKIELEKYTSEEEIYQAKIEAWEKLKPTR